MLEHGHHQQPDDRRHRQRPGGAWSDRRHDQCSAPPALSGLNPDHRRHRQRHCATNITFGTGAGQVSTLNQLNAALAANNLQASISTTGQITIATTNNAASSTIGAITGTATASGQPFAGLTAAAPVADPNSQATRASLVAQYNNVLQQINTTSQDSSFNGINLLNGDTLNLTFDETGTSTLAIPGFTFNDAGLGLSTLTAAPTSWTATRPTTCWRS